MIGLTLIPCFVVLCILSHKVFMYPSVVNYIHGLVTNKLGHGDTPDAPVRRFCDSISTSVGIPVGCSGCLVVQPSAAHVVALCVLRLHVVVHLSGAEYINDLVVARGTSICGRHSAVIKFLQFIVGAVITANFNTAAISRGKDPPDGMVVSVESWRLSVPRPIGVETKWHFPEPVFEDETPFLHTQKPIACRAKVESDSIQLVGKNSNECRSMESES